MSDQENQETHICPGCGASNTEDVLKSREYRCAKCNLEQAHLDIAANGVIRGVFGWLRCEGDTIEDRYHVKSVLGKGGFGATYLVEDVRLNGKRRALKEVPELMFDEYETTLLSRLNHPSIPDIIDRIETDGMVYLVLEFGGSRTLGGERKRYPNQRIPEDKLLPWMHQLCEVLIYLHSQTPPIIHRDLKPDNILLDENGRIMLIDFGIAKESKPATMTRTLGRAATHGFSPPEQAMGTGTDERSDIYALAATFYALLTGENPPAAHERVAGKDLIPPRSLVPEVSPRLEETLLQALNLNVNRRQQTVQEFSQALEQLENFGRTATSYNTAYTDRTVIVGRTNGSTSTVHPPSIKLPSGRLSTSATEAPSGPEKKPDASRRNAAILAIGLTVIVALLMTLGYLFWPNPSSKAEQPAESAGIAPPPTPQTPATVTDTAETPKTATTQTSGEPQNTLVSPNAPTPTVSKTVTKPADGSAWEAFQKEKQKSTDTEVSPAPVARVQEPEPKPAPVRKPVKRPARPTATSRTAPPPASNDWLNEFKQSQTRIK
ncbi:MAG: serine/threonine protein kinase [Gammaproteobacteria bacterium]